jgi:regulatory protein
LDGRFTFSLNLEVVAREHLHVGRELTEAELEALAGADASQRCFEAAARLLGYRPRSETELSQRLARRGFGQDVIEQVIRRLREQGLVDDASFARTWRDNREAVRPCGRQLIRRELREKGISEDIIDGTVSDLDEETSAYQAARNRLGSLPRDDYPAFRRRLGEYLRRRGFDYGIISQTVRQVWQEHQSPSE